MSESLTILESGFDTLKHYGNNREMADEARIARFDQFIKPDSMCRRPHSRRHTHILATEVEAIIGAVWVDSGRDWEVTKDCYARIRDHLVT